MKWQKLTLLILLCCGGLYAQWGYDTTNPNVIESTLLGSYSPQTCIAEDGSAYFGWIEYSAGQRNCYLQKIDSYGSNIWTAPVMIFSTGSDISTNDWNMVLDNNGYPIVVVSKCLTGSKNVSAYKVSPAGSLLWGNDGIALSADTLSAYTNLQPAVTVTTQNQIVVAWQHTDTAVTIRCQALSPEGNLLWGADGITENIENNLLSAPQLIPSDYGSVLLKYHADSGMISLHILAG
jgi:hypothetical protein